MDDRLKDLERAAVADPGELALIRAYQRGRRPETDSLLADFAAVLLAATWSVGAAMTWVGERCDRRQTVELFSAAFEHPQESVRKRSVWILGFLEPSLAFPMLLALVEDVEEERESLAVKLRVIALNKPGAFELYWRAIQDERVTTAPIRALLNALLLKVADRRELPQANLIRALSTRVEEDRFVILWRIRKKCDSQTLELLGPALAAYPEKSKKVWWWAIQRLRTVSWPDSPRSLMLLIRAVDPEIYARILVDPESYMTPSVVRRMPDFEIQ